MSPRMMITSIDTYLDELFDALIGTGGAGRRALAEAEDHLRAAAAEGVASGLSQADAEAAAVARFGSARGIAAALRRAHLSLADLARAGFVGVWLVGGLVLVGIGLSGLFAEAIGRLAGAGFVAGDPSGVTYTAERCADYFEYFPNAGSCADAAAQHHWGEIVEYRVAAGVLGVFALIVLAVARRSVLAGPRWSPRPAYVAVVLLALYGVAAGMLGGVALMSIVFGQTSGVGVDLADAAASLVAVVVIGLWGLRAQRRTLHDLRNV